MKFEFQTNNRIWRNDGRGSPTRLGRKYGPLDYIVDMKGARLESEGSHGEGYIEFETEWFRKWPALEHAINKAMSMTARMGGAPPAKFDRSRRAFPFEKEIDDLRTGTAEELKRGYWNKRPGTEAPPGGERILGKTEELEVELIDISWQAGIQSSECFMLAQYESYLRDYEWPYYRDGALNNAKAVLDAANRGRVADTQLENLRNLLSILVNYLMRGRGGEVSRRYGGFISGRGLAAKQAFTLMCRTNFASIFRHLLSAQEKRLFKDIVDRELLLRATGLGRR